MFNLFFQALLVAWRFLDWIDRHHETVLVLIIVKYVIHLGFSILMMIGLVKQRKSFFLPWIISQIFMILITLISFIILIYLSFFVHITLSIVFPIISGLVLGLLLSMWLEVYSKLRNVDICEKYEPMIDANNENGGE